MQKLNVLRDEVFAINKANGWHEQKRSFGELIALVHSEVSEALEDYRNGKAVDEVWFEYKDEDGRFETSSPDFCGALGKPCGIPSELADIIIRIVDICGLYDWNIEEVYNKPISLKTSFKFAEFLSVLHLRLSRSFESYFDEEVYAAIYELAAALKLIDEFCFRESIDLESIIRQKLEYNKTRGYKHGGKVI